jgi:hypothetical protein
MYLFPLLTERQAFGFLDGLKLFDKKHYRLAVFCSRESKRMASGPERKGSRFICNPFGGWLK